MKMKYMDERWPTPFKFGRTQKTAGVELVDMQFEGNSSFSLSVENNDACIESLTNQIDDMKSVLFELSKTAPEAFRKAYYESEVTK